MADYAQQLQKLQNSVLTGDMEAVYSHIAAHHAIFPADARVKVYSNGYDQRMANAVKMDFPALQHFLGETAFHALIEAYIRATPSNIWDMNRYSFALPSFMQAKSMTANDACAIATLEATIMDVFWSPTSAPLTAESLTALDEDAFGAMRVQLRRDVRLLSMYYDAEAYLTAFRADSPLAALPMHPTYLVVLRHQHEVIRIMIDYLHFELLQHFRTPCSFNDAFGSTTDPEQLAHYLPHYTAQWLQYGILSNAD